MAMQAQQCQEAFDQLKETLLIALILTYSTANQALLLETDVSEAGLGAVLSQTETDGTTTSCICQLGTFPPAMGCLYCSVVGS